MLPTLEYDRYVLIRTLPDGTPNRVRPVSNLKQGERILNQLCQAGETRWQLFDTQESRRVAGSTSSAVPSKSPAQPRAPSTSSSNPSS